MQANTPYIKQQTLRVGFDAKRAFNNGTGLGNYARFIINGLVRLYPQHEYFLFTPTIKPEYENFFPSAKNVHLVTPQHFVSKKFSALWRTYAIADLCTLLELDIFHGLSNELPLGIERFLGKKIVTIHDLIFLRYPAYYNNIDRFIYTKKFKRACEHADLILAASGQTRKDIIEYFGTTSGKIAVAYQNCDERFAVEVSEADKQHIRQTYSLPTQFVLCIGTIEQRKHQLTVLKAFHQLNDPNLSLVFVGKQTEYADQLHAYILAHHLTKNIRFLQHIPSDHLPAIYQLARVFVYASEFEGFGIPVLEGMRSGIPVIAARASSLPEVGGNAITYFEPGDTSDLSRCIAKHLSKPFSDTSYQEQLKQFETNKLIEQLVSFYQS
jgi:glycosyltransferase involved in cell wall biosynthesis